MPDAALDMSVDRLPDPLGGLFRYWDGIKGDRPLPNRCDFDPIAIPQLLPHLILVEVLRDEADGQVADFRFRVIGTHVDERMSDRYTGRRLSQIPNKRRGSKIWDTYQAVEREAEPKVISLDYIGPAERTKETTEIFLPLSAGGGQVDFIVVGLSFA